MFWGNFILQTLLLIFQPAIEGTWSFTQGEVWAQRGLGGQRKAGWDFYFLITDRLGVNHFRLQGCQHLLDPAQLGSELQPGAKEKRASPSL